MKKSLLFTIFILTFSGIAAHAQIDSTLLRPSTKDTTTAKDTVRQSLSMDVLYGRPILNTGKLPITIGGYVEANWQHLSTDGATVGQQYQFRRVSLFFAASIAPRIKFITELEFENDADVLADNDNASGPETEVEVEYAALDVNFDPLLNFRGGMIVNPIGSFNENHDGPKWEFTDRPIAMTDLLPDTWSNAGFGLYGKKYWDGWMFGYEAYLTGGFNDSIISNTENKTFLPAAKTNPTRFISSASGEPLTTAKISVGNGALNELGFSYMSGVYNTWMTDATVVDAERSVRVFDADCNVTLPGTNTNLIAEWAWIHVDVPSTYTQQYGSAQQGGFMDIVQPVYTHSMLGWENATFSLALRLEYVDWNVGTFTETGTNIGDDLWSIMPAISFRPVSGTVFRFNYRYMEQYDILGDPPSHTGGFILGISSYF
jgi:hypothetical protein